MKIQEVVHQTVAKAPELPRRRAATLWLDEAPYEKIIKCCKLLNISSSKLYNAFSHSIADNLVAECIDKGIVPPGEKSC